MSTERLAAMLDGDDVDSRPSNEQVALNLPTLDGEVDEMQVCANSVCPKCDTVFYGQSEVPVVHLASCMDIPLKHEIDEVDDGFMPKTPEPLTPDDDDKVVFKLGSNIPSGADRLNFEMADISPPQRPKSSTLPTLTQNSAFDNKIHTTKPNPEAVKPAIFASVPSAKRRKPVIEIPALPVEPPAKPLLQPSVTVDVSRPSRRPSITSSSGHKTPPVATTVVAPVTAPATDAAIVIEASDDERRKEILAKRIERKKKKKDKKKIKGLAEGPSSSKKAKLSRKPNTLVGEPVPASQIIGKGSSKLVRVATVPMSSEDTNSPKRPASTSIANTWFKLKQGDNLTCTWCKTDLSPQRKASDRCLCGHEVYNVKIVKHAHLPEFLKGHPQLKKKEGFEERHKPWLVCYRCGWLSKNETKATEHCKKQHDDGDDRIMCHHCPCKFYTQREFLDHDDGPKAAVKKARSCRLP